MEKMFGGWNSMLLRNSCKVCHKNSAQNFYPIILTLLFYILSQTSIFINHWFCHSRNFQRLLRIWTYSLSRERNKSRQQDIQNQRHQPNTKTPKTELKNLATLSSQPCIPSGSTVTHDRTNTGYYKDPNIGMWTYYMLNILLLLVIKSYQFKDTTWVLILVKCSLCFMTSIHILNLTVIDRLAYYYATWYIQLKFIKVR